MPRTPKRDADTIDFLQDDLDRLSAEQVRAQLEVKALKHYIWSHHKARLIELYLKGFCWVTHHGTYIDGFAGPQQPDKPESWSAKRVIETEPRRLRHFFLCELNRPKVGQLQKLWNCQEPRRKGEPNRTCEVLSGDFNVTVSKVLESGVITEKEASFALLDQRTFECHWATLQKLAAHKVTENKIELFYFLAVGWLHRSFSGIKKRPEKVQAWWGPGDGWRDFRKLKQLEMAVAFSERIRVELGYKYVVPYPIRERERGEGKVMYYMIHATDHAAAPDLMWRAYNQAIQPIKPPDQGDFGRELGWPVPEKKGNDAKVTSRPRTL